MNNKKTSGPTVQSRLQFGISKGLAGTDAKSAVKETFNDVSHVKPPVVKNEQQEHKGQVEKQSEREASPNRHSLDVTDPRYEQYLKHALSHRLTEAVHEEDYDVVEKLLRQFDFCTDYGPVNGMTRLQRWNRADRLGLNPPSLVKEILETDQGVEDPKYRESYLFGYV